MRPAIRLDVKRRKLLQCATLGSVEVAGGRKPALGSPANQPSPASPPRRTEGTCEVKPLSDARHRGANGNGNYEEESWQEERAAKRSTKAKPAKKTAKKAKRSLKVKTAKKAKK